MSLWAHLGDDTGSIESNLQSFLGLYVFALLYELVLSYDALRRRNTIQLIGLCFCNVGLTAYGVLQMREIEPTLESLIRNALIDTRLLHFYRAVLIVVPILLGIGTLCMSFLTWKLRAEFSWSIYKNISADLQMKRRYFTYQVCNLGTPTLFSRLGLNIPYAGVHRFTEIRLFLPVWNTTSASSHRCQISEHRFHCQCCSSTSNHRKLGTVSILLQTREEKVSHWHF